MKIVKELFRGKRLADGSFPVLIRICHKGSLRRISTSVGVFPSYWNKASQSVSKKDILHRQKNDRITSLYNKVYLNPEKYLPKTGPTPDDSQIPKLIPLIDQKISTLSNHNSRKAYISLKNFILENFSEAITVDDNFLRDFIKKLNSEYPDSNTMKKQHCIKLKAVLNHASDIKLLPDNWSSFRFPKFSNPEKDHNLSLYEEQTLFAAAKAAILPPNSSIPDEHDSSDCKDTSNSISFTSKERNALRLFLLTLFFQGLAPVDMSELRISDMKKIAGNEITDDAAYSHKEVIILAIQRRKTCQPVRLVMDKDIILPFLPCRIGERDIFMLEESEHLLDCLDGIETMTAVQRQNRLCNWWHRRTEELNSAVGRYCEATGRTKPKRITFYHARHVYCNLLNRCGISHDIIRQLIGHRRTVLERSYLAPLSDKTRLEIYAKVFQLVMHNPLSISN